MSNKLKYEKSPYLSQHKDNPVDWYPWGEEAFQKAKEEDKPIFLSIGYSTCHWCHVMAHESFEDTQIARLLDDYVCIKVDREERPDIDSVYMSVCQAMTGSGGWPLTIFMTPEQKPFFAGTYFPKESQYGHIGLKDLLNQISYLWHTEREKLISSGEKITSALKQYSKNGLGQADKSFIHKAYELLLKSFDSKWGGFGSAPKFPAPHNLLFLMHLYEYEKNADALNMVETTLKSMARGGIFDHIGGGFSRYSTDEKWLVPHFEKMLYDNALLLLTYLEAFQITKNPFYAYVAKQTADYILKELTSPDGGFYCGQDADSDGIEGKYYVFTMEEIIKVLGEKDSKEFCNEYNITERGNFEGKNIPNRIGLTDKEQHHYDPRLKSLFEYRKSRTNLHLDNKILLSWNSWTIMAMARAGLILKDDIYIKAAIKAQNFINEKMTGSNNRLFLRYCGGEAANAGQLDDYAVYALSLLELYNVTFKIDYLEEAVSRTKQMIDLFEDKENGGYYLTAHDAESLIHRPKDTYDGAIPSGNSAAAMVLAKLAALTGESSFREASNRQNNFIAGQAAEYPPAHCFGLSAMMISIFPHKELIFTGEELPAEILTYLSQHPAQNLSAIHKSRKNQNALSQIAPFTSSYPINDITLWYICENGACHAPTTKFRELGL